MFNQLPPAEIVTAIGATLRRAARTEGAASDFDRDQLMSAFSATRHLAVELASFEPEFRRFKEAVAEQIRATNAPAIGDQLGPIADRLKAAPDGAAAGGVLCELFELLRQDGSEPARALRSQIHVHLRALADREVDLLADALG
jgi:hypothetical protein